MAKVQLPLTKFDAKEENVIEPWPFLKYWSDVNGLSSKAIFIDGVKIQFNSLKHDFLKRSCAFVNKHTIR